MPNQYLKGTVFVPSSLNITAISQATQGIITCTVDPVTEENTYIPGMLVRLFIPSSYGMQQLANQTVQIVKVSGLNFTINVNTTNFDPFSAPITGQQPASMAPSGSQNVQWDNTTAPLAFQPNTSSGN